MPVPPPFRDPSHIETRLLVVAAMLEKAVAEVHRAMDEIRPLVDDDPTVFDHPNNTGSGDGPISR